MLHDQTSLELSLHLQDGRVDRFTQSNPELVVNLLDTIRPGKVFAGQTILLRGEESVTIYPTDRVTRIDVGQRSADWIEDADTLFVDQIADYDFRWLCETLATVRETLSRAICLENVILAAEAEFSNGEKIYLRIEFRPAVQAQAAEMLAQRVFSSGGLLVRLRNGGYTILNPSNIVRLTIHPVIKDVSAGCDELLSK